MTKLVITIPGLVLASPNTKRFTTRVGAAMETRRVRNIRQCVKLHCMAALKRRKATPSKIIVRRLSVGRLDDGNLANAFKPAEDGIADALGVNDKCFVWFGDRDGIPFVPMQEKCKRGAHGVVIELHFAEAA